MARSRNRCHQCHRPREVVGYVSKRGLCEDCALENIRANVVAVQGRDEMAHEVWLARWREACGEYGRPVTPF